MNLYSDKYFIKSLFLKFGIDIGNENVGEESILLDKEEIDEFLVSEELLIITPKVVMIHSYIYNNEEHEWLVCVASDANTNQPLFLLCLKNGLKVYEEILIGGNDSGNDSKETF
ncbi:hypothetical protein ACV3PA_02690 [Exiguobacterium acetylicum]